MPAVKYKVLGSPPLPPLPNAIAHRPEFTMGWPFLSCRVPRVTPVLGSNALMRPLPKFPTRTAPPKAPHVAGAIATPQGEFKTSFEIRRFRNVPLRSNTLTKPFPGPARSRFLAAFCFAYMTYSLPPRFQMLKGANPLGRLGS